MAAEHKNADTVVLVTGANGFVASHLVEQLLAKGYTVRGTVRSLADEKKTAHLTRMPGAAERLKLLEASLTEPGSFDEACRGAHYVMHTASPYSMRVEDPQRDLVDPAVRGTAFVLASVRAAGTVKRVVLTSSVAAVTDEPETGKVLTEEDWNTKSNLSRNPYYFSKVLAEKEAWRIAKEHNTDLVVINPFVVCGPSHTSAVNDSIEVFRSLLTGRYPAIMQLCWGFVDVRDVARAHIAAMETPAAKGRYICANVVLNMRQLVEKLSARFPGYKYPSVSMENALGNGLVKLGSFFQPGQIGSYLRTHLGRVVAFDNSKIKRELQMEFTDIDKSIDDTVVDLIKWGHVEDLRPRALSDEEAKDLGARLRDAATGIARKENCSIANSFQGAELVSWLEKTLALRHRSQATRLAEALVAKGVVKPLSKPAAGFSDNREVFGLA